MHTGSTTTAAWMVSANGQGHTQEFWVIRAVVSVLHAGQWLCVPTVVLHFRANSTSGHKKIIYYCKTMLKLMRFCHGASESNEIVSPESDS